MNKDVPYCQSGDLTCTAYAEGETVPCKGGLVKKALPQRNILDTEVYYLYITNKQKDIVGIYLMSIYCNVYCIQVVYVNDCAPLEYSRQFNVVLEYLCEYFDFNQSWEISNAIAPLVCAYYPPELEPVTTEWPGQWKRTTRHAKTNVLEETLPIPQQEYTCRLSFNRHHDIITTHTYPYGARKLADEINYSVDALERKFAGKTVGNCPKLSDVQGMFTDWVTKYGGICDDSIEAQVDVSHERFQKLFS